VSVFSASEPVLCDAAIAAAHELGLFDGAAPRQTHRLRALRAVLDALGAFAAPPARPEVQRAGWGLLADVIRSDRPLPIGDGELPRYHDHLVRAGAPAAREVAALLGGGSLLDLGGGAGAYTAAFLDRYPAARATLVDSAAVVALAAEHLAPFAPRVTFVAGDAREVAVARHDTVVLANVLHLHGAAACAELCAAAGRAVAPGGTVAIVDFHVEPDRSGPLASLLFALGMAIYTDAGDVHDADAIAGWLADAGLVDVELQRLASDPSALLVRARRPALDMPLRFRRALGRAMLDGGDIANQLRTHYAETMPAARAGQLADPVFRAPLDWSRLPRLSRAIARLEAVLADAGVAHAVPRTRTLGELYEGTFYGAFMPLLAYRPREGEPHEVIERYLVAPIMHELAHLARDRAGGLELLHVDECVAGWLGTYVHPDMRDDTLYAAAFLAQVGQAFARAFGVRRLVRAHAGVEPLPGDITEHAARLGRDDWRARRTLHLLSDTLDPRPWVALALAAGAGRPLAGETLASLAALDLAELALPDDDAFDLAIVADGLRAMGSAPVTIDAHACEITAPGEPIALRYWLPPAVARRLRAGGGLH